MPEIWRDIIDWEGWYKVSDQANVQSLDRWITYSDGRRRFCVSQILKQCINPHGYLSITLSKGGNHKIYRVHRLVGLAFIDKDWTGEFDHKDLNKLNNVVNNLRTATSSQNKANQIKRKGTSSRYKGVCLKKGRKRNPWVSRIQINNKLIYLGAFPTQELAAAAYNKSALEHFGNFARTNEI